METKEYKLIRPTWSTAYWMLGIYDIDTEEYDDFYKLDYRSLLSLGEACSWVSRGGYGSQVTRCIRLDVDPCPSLNGHPVTMYQLSKLYREIKGAVDYAHNQG